MTTTRSTTRCAPTSTSVTGGRGRASRSTGGASTLPRHTRAHSRCTARRNRSCAASSVTISTKRSSPTWKPARQRPMPRPPSTGSGIGALSLPTGGPRFRSLWLQYHGQSLELIDERRLDELAVADDLHVRVAPDRFLEHDLQLEARQRRTEAEVPATGAECLVIGIALDVEAVRILDLGLVAVRRRVPHDYLLAILDVGVVQLNVLRRSAPEMRERREHP